MSLQSRATVEDLYREEGKAELVCGTLVRDDAGGDAHNRAAGAIYFSLRLHERRAQAGRAYADNAGFLVDLPERQSFCPDAAFYIGPRFGPDFLQGAPAFAAEVRSKHDYGPLAEQRLARKRADYFAAGTLVVWDVDLLEEQLVRVYRAGTPHAPTCYRRGQQAEAEPAVPGWRLGVDELFA